MWSTLANIFGISCLIVLLVVCVSLQFDIGPKNPKWRRRWAVFAYSIMGSFLLWLVVLFLFIKPQVQ